MQYDATDIQPLGFGPLTWMTIAGGTAKGADVVTGLIARRKAAKDAKKTARTREAMEAAEAELAEVEAELQKIQMQQFMLYAMTAGALILGGVAGYALARYAHKRGKK